MFGGLSAKERMAQLQAKSAKEAAPAKPPGPGALKKVGKLNGAASKTDDAAVKAKSPDNAKELVKAKEEEKAKLEDKKEPAKPAADGVKKEEKAKEEPTTTSKEPKKADTKPAEETKSAETKKDDSKSTAAKKEEKPKTEKPKDEPAKKEVKEEPKPKNESKAKPEAKPAAAEVPAAKPKEETPKKPEAKDEAKAKPTEATPKKDTPKPTDDAKKTAEPEKKPEKKPADEKKETPKPKEEAKPAEPAKQKEEAPKPTAAVSDKPKEQPKPAAEKPKEEAKKPEVKDTAPVTKPTDEKPKDVPKPAAPAVASTSTVQPPKEAAQKQETKAVEKPKEEAKKPAAAEAKPQPSVAASATTAAPTPEVKPAEVKKPETPAVKPESKPAETPKPVAATNGEFKPTSDELFTAIFYFSGMGSLLGSALAEGVFVPERSRRTALDADEIEAAAKTAATSSPHRRGDQVVATARSQAHVLSNDFRQLQALLENMPSFGDKSSVDASLLPSASTATKPVDRRAVEQPIHGHVYFQQPDRPHPPPQQQVQHHQPQPQPVLAQAPPYQTPTAVAVHAADVEFGSTVVQLATLHPPSSGGGRSRPAAGAVQVLPVGVSPSPAPAPQTNFTSAVYRPPQPSVSRTPVNFDGVDGYDAASHVKPHHQLPPSQPWQERYGPDATGRGSSSGPRPYGASAGGDVDSTGIKSWQLSHLRTLEAKGYRVAPGASVTPSPAVAAVDDQLDGEVHSYAPYLVSDRTLNADRRQTFQRAGGSGSVSTTDGYLSSPAIGGHNRGSSPYQQQQQQPRPYRPPSGAGIYPFSPNADNSLPYCDL